MLNESGDSFFGVQVVSMWIFHPLQGDTVLSRILRASLVTASLAAAVSCTALTDDPDARAAATEANDPLQPFNRTMFAFNSTVDSGILEPAARIYRGAVPAPARQAIGNALDNLSEPITLMNDLLQGEFVRARETTVRFVLNSTIGLGGTVDFMSEVGIKRHKEDFGQTLAVWGVPEGPYLVLPLLGPSNFRDLAGYGVDSFADPVNRTFRGNDAKWAPWARAGADAVHTRSELLDQLEELERTSIDYYTTVRSVYRQRRQSEILNGKTVPAPSLFAPDGNADG